MKELMYLKIFRAISEEITSNRLEPGDRLDGVRELAGKWNTSTNTVLKALDELERGGYIRKNRGRGIFVEGPESYRPDSGSAAEAASAENRVLELYLYDMDVPFNRLIISGVEKAAASYGFSLTVKRTSAVDDSVKRVLPSIIVPSAAPYLNAAPSGDSSEAASDAAQPVVYCGDFSPPSGFSGSYAVVDAYSGYYRAADLLFKSGRERIAYIGGSGSIEAEAGWNACRDLLSGTNKGFRRDYAVSAGGWNAERGEEALENLLLGGEFPDGIVCSNDALAAGVLKACRRAGLSVPADIAVTGAGDGAVAPLLEPPLTSLRMSAENLAYTAVGYISNRLAGNLSEPLRVRIDMELVERDSTAVPEGEDTGGEDTGGTGTGDGADWL